MGNQTAKPSSPSGGFNILPVESLTQTSLQPSNKRTGPSLLLPRSPVEMRKLNRNDQHLDKRDSPDKPDSKSFCHSPRYPHDYSTVTENDFHIMQIMSCEKLGRVYLVKKNDDGRLYAMKTFCKKKAHSLDRLDSVDVEKDILKDAKHPFIPSIKYAFENDKKIFLVTDYFEATELHTILKSLTRFSEEITRFYSAEILIALEYLRKEMNIVFTDLKIEHIVVDSEGHIKIANFEGAEYEIGNRYNFWYLGCLIYEMLTGNKPFNGDYSEIKDLDQETLEKRLHWSSAITVTAKDLVIRLLSGKTDETLRFNNFDEIKKHAFFAEVRWDKIHHRLIYPPLSPSLYKAKKGEDDEAFTNEEQSQPSFFNFDVKTVQEDTTSGIKALRGKSCDEAFEASLSTTDT